MGKPAIRQQEESIPILRIAGLTVAIAGAQFLLDYGRDYLVGEGTELDITFDIKEEAFRFMQKHPDASWDKCCYIASAHRFYAHLLPYDGFVLHASAVVLDGKAYLFSADSGTGKSTHTSLWCMHFGEKRAHIINDDKPIIRKIGGHYLAYGAPWCGSGLNTNECVPVQGVAFIERSEDDWIEPMPAKEALIQLLRQSDPTVRREAMGTLLTLLHDFMNQIPIFKMGCTVSKNAVLTAHGVMAEM